MYSEFFYSSISYIIKNDCQLQIPYTDFTIPDDSYTKKLFMNYFDDCCIQTSYITLLYQVYLEIFYYSSPRENFFLWKILINEKCYFKINNEALRGKRIFLSYLCDYLTPPLHICLLRVGKSQMRKFVG